MKFDVLRKEDEKRSKEEVDKFLSQEREKTKVGFWTQETQVHRDWPKLLWTFWFRGVCVTGIHHPSTFGRKRQKRRRTPRNAFPHESWSSQVCWRATAGKDQNSGKHDRSCLWLACRRTTMIAGWIGGERAPKRQGTGVKKRELEVKREEHSTKEEGRENMAWVCVKRWGHVSNVDGRTLLRLFCPCVALMAPDFFVGCFFAGRPDGSSTATGEHRPLPRVCQAPTEAADLQLRERNRRFWVVNESRTGESELRCPRVWVEHRRNYHWTGIGLQDFSMLQPPHPTTLRVGWQTRRWDRTWDIWTYSRFQPSALAPKRTSHSEAWKNIIRALLDYLLSLFQRKYITMKETSMPWRAFVTRPPLRCGFQGGQTPTELQSRKSQFCSGGGGGGGGGQKINIPKLSNQKIDKSNLANSYPQKWIKCLCGVLKLIPNIRYNP